MSRCPICGSENQKPEKTWKYGNFTVLAYICGNCKTRYRNYYNKNGNCRFTLKLEKGKGYIKA